MKTEWYGVEVNPENPDWNEARVRLDAVLQSYGYSLPALRYNRMKGQDLSGVKRYRLDAEVPVGKTESIPT